MRFLFRLVLLLVILSVLALAGFRLAAHLREVDGPAAAPGQGRFIETPLGPIYAITMGPEDGEPVLLIHGSVGWSGTWQHTQEALADAGYFAIAIDVPPMGYSPRSPEGDYGRAMSAERIAAVNASFGLTPHIVAHSFGAGAAMEAVMRGPDDYQSLTIIAGALPLDPPDDIALPAMLRPLWLREVLVSASVTNPLAARPLLQAFLHRDEAATDEILEVLAAPATQDGATEALARWLPTLLVPPAGLPSTQSQSFRALDIPTGLIWGAEDTTTPHEQGEHLATLIPGAALTVIPDVGHIPMIEDPDAFTAALLDTLASFTAR
ncbi:alpha/beta fold hydrolase [Hasllibacter sp. MH4015]|uniref:alpha/beta fold hydrolase n=1 Tax=Hasllibacter sp. MH4015 TaxID=2854029 RepID=UPI001CD4944A|nr:alpha/beta hydrolase [Hasllibacter sp. MH4015]